MSSSLYVWKSRGVDRAGPQGGGGGDGDGSDQVGGGGGLQLVVLVGDAVSRNCLCDRFPFPLCPQTYTHSMIF